MCYAFVSYFPKMPGFDQCVQYDHYDQCNNYNQQSETVTILVTTCDYQIRVVTETCLAALIMGDCNFRRFTFDMGGEIALVTRDCKDLSTVNCESKCMKSIRNIYGHPCMQVRGRKCHAS